MESLIGDPGKAVDSSDQNNSSLFRWLTILASLAFLSLLVMHQTDREYSNNVPALRQSDRSKATCARAERLFQENLHTEAYDLFARASRLDEGNPSAWIGRAKAACELHRYSQARRSSIYGIILCQGASRTELSDLWYYEALAKFKEEDHAGAKSSLSVCLDYNPSSPGGLALLSKLASK